MSAGPTLADWIARQEAMSAAALAAAVSPTDLVHERPGFGQTVRPAPGAVLASRHRAHWDPEPDYFHHWLRDAAMVMRVAPLLALRDGSGWRRRMAEHVAFSLRLCAPPGLAANPLKEHTQPEFRQFLRPDEELAALDADADAVRGEPRWGADGRPDLERWARPQHDGPALRALSLLAWDDPAPEGMAELLAGDLAYTLRHAAEPCVGPWEEEADLHAFTLMAQRAALRAGARRGLLDPDLAATAVARTEAALAALRLPEGSLRGRAGSPEPDAAVVLGALLAEPGERFGPADPAVLATAAALSDRAAADYPADLGAGLAIGRSSSDRFFGGNPWVPVTLGFAELMFVLARHVLEGGDIPRRARLARFREMVFGTEAPDGRRIEARALVARGERHMAVVRRACDGTGRLAEQFGRADGRPCSCPDLAWSHAGFVAAAAARRAALAGLRRPEPRAAGS